MNKIPRWVWLTGLVILSLALEYGRAEGFAWLDRKLTRRQKTITCLALIFVAVAALSYGLFRTYQLWR